VACQTTAREASAQLASLGMQPETPGLDGGRPGALLLLLARVRAAPLSAHTGSEPADRTVGSPPRRRSLSWSRPVRDLPFRPAMRVRVSSLSPALCLITAAAGQDRLIAYPQDTWSYPTSDAAPLGSHPAIQTVEEGRWQALIPHTHLPTTPVTIVGFSVIS